MPCRDFVLYIRDSMMEYPTAFASVTKSGQQAINLNMLPDYRTKAAKYQVTSQVRKQLDYLNKFDVDVSTKVKYEVEASELEVTLGNEDSGESSDDEESKIEEKPKSPKRGLLGIFSKGLKCFDDLSPRNLKCCEVGNE